MTGLRYSPYNYYTFNINYRVYNPFTSQFLITGPFNNMGTLKLKAQPTNVFFATVNQMFGGSSQLSTSAERAVPCFRTMFLRKEVSGYGTVFEIRRKMEGAVEHLIDGSEKRICR